MLTRVYKKIEPTTPARSNRSEPIAKKAKDANVRTIVQPGETSAVLLRLQRQYGNRYVQGLLNKDTDSEVVRRHEVPPSVQRYAVPNELACEELVAWLKTNSPYAPDWAENRVNYKFSPQNFVNVTFKEIGEGQVEGTAIGMKRTKVLMSSPTDLPRWNPSKRPHGPAELQAWQVMLAALRAHENEHIRIGRTWQLKLEAKAKAVKLTATGNSRADVQSQLAEQLQTEAEGWIGEAQAEQDQFDTSSAHGAKAYKNLPVVTLTCPAAEP